MADLLASRARLLLDDLRAFSTTAGFDPARLNACFTIAANDLQRDLLLPGLLRHLRDQAPGLTLRVIPSGAPQAAMLREETCQLLITPRPPEGSDIFQKRLFEDQHRVFFDPALRAAPASLADYLAADHVTVLYEPRRSLDVDQWLLAQGVQRRILATVPGMAGLGALLRGGPWLATAPSLLGQGALRGLAMAEVPLAMPPMPMYMVWHRRHHADPVQRWLRDALEAEVARLGLAAA
jgi:DNA-binding transcriptional LysR family regulator